MLDPRRLFRAATWALALVPAAAFLALSHGLRAQDTGAPTAPLTQAERIQRTADRFQGAWQLVSARMSEVHISPSALAGYLIVAEGHMSLEVHMMLTSDLPQQTPAPYLQTGTYRWRFSQETVLETSTLIGSVSTNGGATFDFEPPGTKRTFTANVRDKTLTLERGSEARLEFKRLPALPFPGRELDAKAESDRSR